MKINIKEFLASKLVVMFRLEKILIKLYPIAISAKYSHIDPKLLNSRILQLGKLLEKTDIAEEEILRFGSDFDGGYYLLGNIANSDSVISLGIGNNVTFEKDLSNIVESQMLYDHTIQELPEKITNATFFKIGISSTDSQGFYTLKQCIELFPPNKNLILKIDVEGDEWEVFANSSIEDLMRFKQIAVEFHNLHNIDDSVFFDKVKSALENLRRNHVVISVHANNWSPFEIVTKVPFPDVIEVTYLRKDLLNTNRFAQKDFRPFNNPNNPNNPNNFDIQLSFLN